ncbi:zinc finger CCCH domain-containing protein 19-like [Macadamia integrifolia]|uniref:zinc finger CCCH domain-containing protein 19-like n=1 Tax=Macadamia integrifolia TaxID=60698 RepID=UPI001C4F2ADD|nr:zinc finger CCCH domain-containing protein 19-like [Macadamia integrifolia]
MARSSLGCMSRCWGPCLDFRYMESIPLPTTWRSKWFLDKLEEEYWKLKHEGWKTTAHYCSSISRFQVAKRSGATEKPRVSLDFHFFVDSYSAGEVEEDPSGLYKSSMEVEHHLSDEKLELAEELPNTQEQCEAVVEMDDSHLLGISPVVVDVATVVEEEGRPTTEVEMETEEAEATEKSGRGGRSKRGTQPRVQTKVLSKGKVEEDVCFVCFDGGNLVLCDRRGCPKAYHPTCVNRDETFFRSKGRWNCGWHICSTCEKSAQFMCYTCTYSLCKTCIKEAEFVSVRGNKGFCGACLRIVMLTEKNEQGSKEMGLVDFNDKNSWEYLFKEYWLDLKGKLSLTFDEVTQARNPWKGSDALGQEEESSVEVYDANEDKGYSSDSSAGNLERSSFKRRKPKKRLKSTKDVNSSSAAGDSVEGMSIPDGAEWASKELLEFVAHMKNGDTSVLSQFDVQALLLEYIKRNNLRDPRRKSQIICDSRLENLFGKARVGHFEMLKLLEVHFLMKEDSHPDDVQGGIVDAEGSLLEVDDNTDALMKAGKDKRRKTRKKGDEKEPQINLDDYAAIDVHNINLIYLRRNLMEELLRDTETFHGKVVGALVRIRISGSSQKQDMYRLVQVVGTCKVDEPYKTGKRTTNFMLEILNLNRTEKISIDTISNQEFSEDECKRLRQSIKCGFIKRMTVGEVQEKAMALQTTRVNDWLETEILRLSHLRDRASEKGHRKELRECVEKLQLLNTPEERSRRLREVPAVHADPKMDPSHESDEDEGEPDDNNRDNYLRPRDGGFGWKGRGPISPGKGGSTSSDNSWSGARKNISASWEPSKIVPGKGSLERRDLHQPNTWEKSNIQVATTGSDADAWTSQATLTSGSSSGLAAMSTPTPSEQSSNISDTEQIWLYQDPSRKIQGPFSMVQLRKWSTTGYFPADLRIWRTTEKRDDSILLTDVLNGKFYLEPPRRDNSFSQSQKAIIASDNGENNWDGCWRGNKSSSWTEKTECDGSWNPSWKDSGSRVNSSGNADYAKNEGWVSQSTGWTAQAMEASKPKEVQGGNSSRGWDSSKANSAWSAQPQVHSPHPSYRMPLQQGRDSQGRDGWSSGSNHGTWNSNESSGIQTSSKHGHEKQSGKWGSSGQSSLESGRSELENRKSWSTASFVETPKFAREGWASDHGRRNDSSNLSTPTTPKPNISGWLGGQVSAPSHPTNSGWGPTQSPRVNVAEHSPASVREPLKSTSDWSEHRHISVKPLLGGWESHSDSPSMPKSSKTLDQGGKIDFSNTPPRTPKPSSGMWTGVQNAGNKWDAALAGTADQTTAGLGGAPNQVRDASPVNEPSKVSVQWGGQSPTPEKSPGGEWESDAQCSTFKQTETINSDEATTSPECSQVNHSSSSPSASVKPSGESGSISGYSESGSGFSTKNEFVSSPSGLVPISATGAKCLIQDHENGFPSLVNGSSSSLDLEKGRSLSCLHDMQIPSQSTVADDPQKFAQANVLYTQKKPSANSLEGAVIDAGIVPGDFLAHVEVEKGELSNSWSDPSAPSSVGRNTNIGVDSEPNTGQKSKAAKSGNPNLDSHGTADHTENHPNPGSSVSELAPSHNWVQLPGTQGSDWSAPSAAPPRQPVSWDVAPGAFHGSFQNRSFAPADPHKPLLAMSRKQCERSSSVHVQSPTNHAWGTTQENSNASGAQPQGNANTGRGGSAQGSTNTVGGADQGTTMEGSTNMGWGTTGVQAEKSGTWASQLKHNGEMFSS